MKQSIQVRPQTKTIAEILGIAEPTEAHKQKVRAMMMSLGYGAKFNK